MAYYKAIEDTDASIVGGLEIEIHNMGIPVLEVPFPDTHWIVCKVIEGEFWYYGRYKDKDRAEKAKLEVNGVIFTEPGFFESKGSSIES